MRAPLRSRLRSFLALALLPPLAVSPGLTSGFGESRDGRFHAGLDYSTEGRTGLPVRAVADGWVERVRASGVGYGRSVYLRLADGRTIVYGHLSGYAPSLDAYVFARQDSSGQYEQDLWPEPGALPFRRGEVLAYSGESGAGPPHLHFEVRRGDMNLHPLRQGITVADGTAPAITAVTLAPANAGTRIAGGTAPWRGTWTKGRALTGPRVSGAFRLLLDTSDRVGTRPNRVGTYRLVVRVDGDVHYEAVLDSVSWEDMPVADRVYDLAATLAGHSHRRALQAAPGDKSGIVRRGPPSWTLPPGPHELEFTAEDESGNRTTRVLRVMAEAAGAPATGGTSNAPPAPAEGSPHAFRVEDDGEAVPLGRLFGGDAGSLVLSWEDGAFYEPEELVAERVPLTDAQSGALVPVDGAALRLEPRTLALRHALRLVWRTADDPRPVGLFRRTTSGWSLLAARDSSGGFSARTRRLGTFAVLADTTAPRIVPPRAYAARSGSIAPAFVARIADAGAGLAAADQVVRLDGRRVPAEYDAEAGRLTWRPRAPLAAGAHVIEVHAVDALGNRSSVRLPVEVR